MKDTSSTIHAPMAGYCRAARSAALRLRRPAQEPLLGTGIAKTHQPHCGASEKDDDCKDDGGDDNKEDRYDNGDVTGNDSNYDHGGRITTTLLCDE